MSVNTIKLLELEKYVDNVYEAVIVIAKRAKQINAEQKRIIEAEISLDEESDIYNGDEEDEFKKREELDYIKLPKPTKVAIEELLTGKLKFEYLSKNEES